MRTQLTLRDLRADALHRLLLSPRGAIAAASDIPGLPDLSGWSSVSLRLAIGDLITSGRMTVDDEGWITVSPLPADEAAA